MNTSSWRQRPAVGLAHLLLATLFLPLGETIHHMKRSPIAYVAQRGETRPLNVLNQCAEPIWAAIATQAGTGPASGGFRLDVGLSKDQQVSPDWQGRVWGRTNCSFNAAGTGAAGTNGWGACTTGDCAGLLNCKSGGAPPATLAEFTLDSSSSQTFYDISLVDGYNIPVAIVSLDAESGKTNLEDIPPNLTNPICIGTAALLASQSDAISTLGSNASFPIPLDQSQSSASVQNWCPWDLQLSPPEKPGDGVYPYPDDNIQRPDFNPCLSACAKYNKPSDCCTGKYDKPGTCQPGLYSQHAKKVCPDAYSYAFDDQDSTFIIPTGSGFQVIFCPPGRSSTILTTMAIQLAQLAETGQVTPQLIADTQNLTLIKLQSGAVRRVGSRYNIAFVLLITSSMLSLL